jgi:hypothetical protein
LTTSFNDSGIQGSPSFEAMMRSPGPITPSKGFMLSPASPLPWSTSSPMLKQLRHQQNAYSSSPLRGFD